MSIDIHRRLLLTVLLTMSASMILRATTSLAQSVNIDAAKKEGKVILYGTVVPQAMEPLFSAFAKKYGIKVEYWRASANGVVERAASEWRAGRPGFDAVEGNPGLNLTLKQEGALARYVAPSSEKFPDAFKDKDSVLIPWRLIPISILYNTELVKPTERPRSLDDFIDPKWKGKLSMPSPLQHAETTQWLWNLPKVRAGHWLDFAKAVAKQEPLMVESFAPVPNKLISGEALIGIGYIKYLKQYKGPLGYALLDKHLTDPNIISLGSKAANPNAARLYIEFLCSSEGQKLVAAQGEFSLFPGVNPPIDDAARVVATSVLMDRPTPEEFKKLNAELRPVFFK